MRNPTRLVSLGGVGGQHLSELCVKVKFNRPYTRLPFDELITTQQFVIDCIENNFEPYHQLNVLIGNLYTTPSRNAFYTNGAINRDKINETINNFYALLNSNKKIIFLRSEAHVHITSKSYLDIFDEKADDIQLWEQFLGRLEEKYPNLDYLFVYFTDDNIISNNRKIVVAKPRYCDETTPNFLRSLLDSHFIEPEKQNRTEFCFVSPNCSSSQIYEHYSKCYDNPIMMALFVNDEQYVEFCENFTYYISLTPKFQSPTVEWYKDPSIKPGYIVMFLEHIEIHFIHHRDENIVKENFYRRLIRFRENNSVPIFYWTSGDHLTSKRDEKFDYLLNRFLSIPNSYYFTRFSEELEKNTLPGKVFLIDSWVGSSDDKHDNEMNPNKIIK